jgi:hypothetical protein
MARLLVARRGDPVRIEGVSDPDDPERELLETDGLLHGPAPPSPVPPSRSGSTPGCEAGRRSARRFGSWPKTSSASR